MVSSHISVIIISMERGSEQITRKCLVWIRLRKWHQAALFKTCLGSSGSCTWCFFPKGSWMQGKMPTRHPATGQPVTAGGQHRALPSGICAQLLPKAALPFRLCALVPLVSGGEHTEGGWWELVGGCGNAEKQQLAEVPRILSFYSGGPILGPLTDRP